MGTEAEGHFTSGLTVSEGQIEYLMNEFAGFCWLDSGSVDLTFIVTLPRHEQFSELSSDLASRWTQFSSNVTEHEQRHVDIFFETMKTTKESIEALSGRFPGCQKLASEVTALWDQAFVTNDALQAGFHEEVADLSRELRGPLEAEISDNETQMAVLDDQVASWSQQTDQLRAELAALDEEMRPYSERIDEIEIEYPDLVLPSGPYEEYEGLVSDWNTLNDERRALISELNALVEVHNSAVLEFNSINSETNNLIEEMNWLP